MALPDALQRYLSRHWGDRAEALWGLALSGPAMLLMLVLLIGPLLAITLLSFSDWQLGMPTMGWVGVDNYRQLAADDVFWQAVRNTAVYVLVVMVGAVGLGLLLALLIEGCTRGKAVYRTLFFLPVMASLVAMTIVWEFLLHPEFGLINQLLMMVGGEPRSWLRDEDWALVALCVIGIWHQAGFNMVLFMAGLTAVPRTLYEAADIDGIPRGFSRFRLITWPLLGPVTLFVVVMTAINAFQVFDTVQILTQGGPSHTTEVLLLTLYREGFEFFRTGYAAAMTVVFLGAVMLITLLKTRFLEKRVHYS
ncbi:sugar ABC transporter permease [Cobetia sp. UIB-001]|uniref:carbohydrate ABC transporter permease n=1 Tax=Cobetia sp. UIB-001 TaxID=2717697 RepID=UPI00384DC091